MSITTRHTQTDAETDTDTETDADTDTLTEIHSIQIDKQDSYDGIDKLTE